MSLPYVLQEGNLLVCDGLYDRKAQLSGHTWTFTPTLQSQLVQSIRNNHLKAENNIEDIYNFIDEAAKREILYHSKLKKDALVLLNIPDGFICHELDYDRIFRKVSTLKRYSKTLVLCLEPTKKMAKSCSRQCIVNASKLHDNGIQFCLRNFNPDNDIHVMMLRCGLVSYFDVDYHNKQALKNYLTDKLTANAGGLILSGVDNAESASMARALPSIYFSGAQFGRKSYY